MAKTNVTSNSGVTEWQNPSRSPDKPMTKTEMPGAVAHPQAIQVVDEVTPKWALSWSLLLNWV